MKKTQIVNSNLLETQLKSFKCKQELPYLFLFNFEVLCIEFAPFVGKRSEGRAISFIEVAQQITRLK